MACAMQLYFCVSCPAIAPEHLVVLPTATVSYGHSYGWNKYCSILKMKHCLLHSPSRMIRVCFGGRKNMYGRKF